MTILKTEAGPSDDLIAVVIGMEFNKTYEQNL
jgi:hypothetical protein